MHSFRAVFKGIKDKYIQDEVTVYAAQASFFIVLAIFPFLMLLMTLVQVLPNISKSDLLTVLTAIMPGMFKSMIVGIVDDLYTKSPGTVISAAAAAALWSSSRGMLSMERGMNRVYETPETRGYIVRRLICAFYTIIFTVMCVVSLVLLVFGDTLQRLITRTFPILERVTRHVISFRSLLSLILCFVVFIGLYTLIPEKKQKPLEQMPGAAFATLGWIIFSYLFSIYINSFSNYSYMYGSLTAVMLLMLWLYFCLCIVFLGAEINYYFSRHQEDD